MYVCMYVRTQASTLQSALEAKHTLVEHLIPVLNLYESTMQSCYNENTKYTNFSRPSRRAPDPEPLEPRAPPTPGSNPKP